MQINYYSLAFSDFRSTKDCFTAFQAFQTDTTTQRFNVVGNSKL